MPNLPITRFLSKTQITQLAFFDIISARIMGEILGNAIYIELFI
ncbi:hypothetical protein [Desulfosporosinus sp. Sb-LF]